MNKRIFSLGTKSLVFISKSCVGNKFCSRNFILSVKNNQQKCYQPGFFKRQQKFLLKEPKAQKKEHKDLESFLSIKDQNLESYVYKGTLYEYETMSCLQKNFGITSKRVGGANDSGIDFRGRWKLPNGQLLNLVGQCKNKSSKCPPCSVRELEGVLGVESENTLGILSSKSGFSQKAIVRFKTSPYPLIIVSVINDGESYKSFMWNKSCEKFLNGFEITEKFFKNDACNESKPILLYNSEPFIPNDEEKHWDTENSKVKET
ncbi:hypothetical protein RclHR1_07240007 [Rhizophagus clarus]|uniref:Restriction endonuclease type IV Mrr domain-containing protein n=1 Tax=Rhizophagus clarus TaxID=94130 RepID=A0A2Z6RVT4_9GLOM|nr:hypothetical protein RclHR1_07240007 [Rhizophagus clarus]